MREEPVGRCCGFWEGVTRDVAGESVAQDAACVMFCEHVNLLAKGPTETDCSGSGSQEHFSQLFQF